MAETGQAGGSGIQLAGAGGAIKAGDGVGQRALAMASALQSKLMAMPASKRSWLLASIAFLAAVCAGMIWYAQRPDWRVLFSGLEGKDVQQVSQELAAAGLPFEMTTDGGGIEVPAEMLDKARMEVAAKGMPQTGRLGFELFDKPNWVGSEFDEKVNYQRAMEGELEHTIGSLGMVRSARVHLVLQQPSLYSAEEKAAKASVVLKLKRASLDADQVEAIRGLVAGAVEGLSPDQVTLVDADGRLNFTQRANGGGSADAEAADVEQAMESKLVAMLEPLAGHDNVRATVNVSYEQGSEERTDEVYDPTQVAALTIQWSCSVLDTEGFTPERMALVMPGRFVEEFGAVPLRVRGERVLHLAFEDRLDASVALAVEKMTNLQVQSGLVESAQLRSSQRRLLECGAVAVKNEALGDADLLAGRITALLEQKQPIDSKLVRLHQYYWLRFWLESGTKSRTGSLPAGVEDMQDYVFTIGA